MKQDCKKYTYCRRPASKCNGKCPEYRKFDWAKERIVGKKVKK